MKEGAAERLEAARDALADVDPWTQDGVEAALNAVVERTGAKPGQVFQPIRLAITGTTVSPGIYESVHLLGQDRTLERIDRALAHAREAAPAARIERSQEPRSGAPETRILKVGSTSPVLVPINRASTMPMLTYASRTIRA